MEVGALRFATTQGAQRGADMVVRLGGGGSIGERRGHLQAGGGKLIAARSVRPKGKRHRRVEDSFGLPGAALGGQVRPDGGVEPGPDLLVVGKLGRDPADQAVQQLRHGALRAEAGDGIDRGRIGRRDPRQEGGHALGPFGGAWALAGREERRRGSADKSDRRHRDADDQRSPPSHEGPDPVAHNFFVPRQLILTNSGRAMGHSYWESRIEAYLTAAYARKAKQLILLDHTPADRHLEAIISPTLFSVRTNRRIFRSLVHLADTKGWQETMRVARERSRGMLTDDQVERHLAVAYDYVMETLRVEGSRARLLDPTGQRPLAQAKRLRRKELVGGGWGDRGRMLEAASSHFGLPDHPLEYWLDSTVTRPWLLPVPPELVAVPESVLLGGRVEPPAA